MVHEPGEARRAEAERLGALLSQGMGGGVQVAHVAQHTGDELEITKQLARATQAQLAIGGAVGVVENRPRGVPAGDAAQVGDRLGLAKTALDGIDDWRTQPQQGLDLVGPQQPAFHLANARELRRDRATRVRVGP